MVIGISRVHLLLSRTYTTLAVEPTRKIGTVVNDTLLVLNS